MPIWGNVTLMGMPAGLVEAFDNVWDAHVSELDEGIEAWDAADDDPEVTKFREWLADMCSGTDMDPELILDPRPELKAMRYEHAEMSQFVASLFSGCELRFSNCMQGIFPWMSVLWSVRSAVSIYVYEFLSWLLRQP